MSPARKAIIALIVANIIWGFASPIFKWSLTGTLPLFTLAFLRFFIGAFCMVVFLLVTKQLQMPRMKIRDWWLLILYTFTAITINIIFFFLGLEKTLSINAPVIASAQPIIIFFIAPFLLGEIISKRKAFGMGIGTIGILAIVLEPLILQGPDGTIIGNVFLMIATFGAVIGTLIGRVLFPRHNVLNLTLWAFIIGALSFLPFALYQHIDFRGYVGIIYGAVFCTAIAYTCFCWGLSKIQASEVSMFTYVDPIAGTILSYFMLHEPITIPFILGAVLIFGGIYIAEGRIHYHPLHRLTGHLIADPDCKTCRN